MTAQNELNNTLRFFCPSCRAELAVPVTMAGIEGPCPSCCETIRAPSAESLPTALTWAPPPLPEAAGPLQAPAPELPAVSAWENSPRSAPPQFPPVREQPLRPIPPLIRSRGELQGLVPAVGPERNFTARRAIPPPDEPLDDSWKDRHRDQRRTTRRAQRREKVAQDILESRGFRLVRGGLILASGAMLAFLFHYLQNHQWRLPGIAPSVASDKSDPQPDDKVRPVANDANELMADDDTEIPPASATIPAPRRSEGPPVSGTPR